MTFRPFEYVATDARILFGIGARGRTAEIAHDLGCARLLVLATPAQQSDAELLAHALGDVCLGVYAKAKMHTPVSVTEDALDVIREQNVDGLVAYGGGSTTGLGKAISYRTGLPHIVLPTTYAGSEVTPILGQTEDGKKVTMRDPKILPEAVIYDPELTLSLPVGMSVTSGLNAVAHAIEALYAENRNPVSSLMAVEGAGALLKALPKVIDRPDDVEARAQALYGAWLCGAVLGQVGMALHHKLCHAIGGRYDLPHAETHAVILPHAIAYNEPQTTELLSPLAQALDVDPLSAGVFDLNADLGAPRSLKSLGMPEDGIDQVTQDILETPYWNPRPMEEAALKGLLTRAYEGHPPMP